MGKLNTSACQIDINTQPSASGQLFGGGYTCQNCYVWVPYGQLHQCHQYTQPYNNVVFQAWDANILAELRAIRELLEKLIKQ